MKWTNYKNARFLLLLAFLTQFATGCMPNQNLSFEGRIHPVTTPGKEESITGFDEAVMIQLETKEGNLLMPMRDYLNGVVQAELPSSFSLQAMKAQAVAARTVALKKMKLGKALCDDPDCCQAYRSAEPAEPVFRAVEETDGEILVYEDALIEAVYFSCSGGMTEAAIDVWGNDVPYLLSVSSPGEENAPHYEEKITIPIKLFRQVLQMEADTIQIEEVAYTAGGGVKTITINGENFTGTQMRSLFNLRSTCFEMQVNEQSVTFTCRGFGHRVGMSQYGAQAMAESGADYREILAYYYNGAEIKKQS